VRAGRDRDLRVQPERAAPADALIDIRDAIRQYDGEFADLE
jgi:hypothetical protein